LPRTPVCRLLSGVGDKMGIINPDGTPMKIYCVKCYTTHDDSLPCFDATAQAAKDMGVNTDKKPASPEQARRDDALLSKAVLIVIAAAVLLVIVGAIIFSR